MGYMTFDNDVDRLTHRPERVHEHQWRSLVYYWGTQKAQKKKYEKQINSEEEDIKSHNRQKIILSCSSKGNK
ncbi:hypothetical protein ACSBR1_009387 [Camellia fascicularis]